MSTELQPGDMVISDGPAVTQADGVDKQEECQVPFGADDICGLPSQSPIHTGNPYGHDFVGHHDQEADVHQEPTQKVLIIDDGRASSFIKAIQDLPNMEVVEIPIADIKMDELVGESEANVKKAFAIPEVDHYDLYTVRPFLKAHGARLTRKRYASTPIREYLSQIRPVELAEQYLKFYDEHPFFQEVCAGAKHHHWWKGGLEDHVREMIGVGMDLMDLYTGDITFTQTDLIIVAFLHDFDKIWLYKYLTPEEREKNPKKFKEKQVFSYVEGVNNILDGYSLKLLELGKYGITPTKEQWSAVLFHEGGYAAHNFDYNGRTKTGDTVMHCNHLAPFMHMLDMYSAMILGRSLV